MCLRALLWLYICHAVSSHVANVLVLLPEVAGPTFSNPFQITQMQVKPILNLAFKQASLLYLNNVDIRIGYNDSNSSDVIGPYHAVEARCKAKLDVVMGFANNYGLAAVARLAWKWGDSGIPVLTTIGMVDALDDQKDYRTLIRMNGSYRFLAQVTTYFLKLFGWSSWDVFFLTHNFNTHNVRSENFFQLAAINNFLKREYNLSITVKNNKTELDETDPSVNYTDIIARVSFYTNIIILCASPDTVHKIMLAAHKLGMVESGEYLFINIDVATGSHSAEPWKRPNATAAENDQAKLAYRAMKTVSLRKSDTPAYKDFESKVSKIADEKYNYTQKTGHPYEMNNFISAFYDAVLLYAIALNETISAGGTPQMGMNITERMWNRTFEGISGSVSIDENGDRYSDYSLLDMDLEDGGRFKEVAYYSGAQGKLIEVPNRKWYWVKGKPPVDTPICGYDHSLCPQQGLKPWHWALIGLAIVTLLFSAVSFFIYRHYRLEAELAAMTWRVRWEELSGEDRKKDREVKVRNGPLSFLPNIVDPYMDQSNPLLPHKTSNSSLKTASIASEETLALDVQQQVFTKTAVYKGTVVAIKRLNISKNKINLTRPLMLSLKKMKDIAHDHVTRFVGACVDNPHYCIVREYCPKGSLLDILENEGIQLDRMMIYSLCHDLVKGLDYIHNSDIRSHGNLRSSNCVVDSRFVLKVTDFGLHELHQLEEEVPDDHEDFEGEHQKFRKMLWVAPELLRNPVGPQGTQKADMYSFSIILHEMLVRQGVFYVEDSDLEPRDIVERVRKGETPPFRPWVDPALSEEKVLRDLMIKCWAEEPLSRPDTTSAKKSIRQLNRQFETSNIVDNLLKRMEQYANNLEGLVEERTSDYMEEKQKVENLLHQLLPASVAETLIHGDSVQAEWFDEVTIYFSDIVGFTSLSSESTPMQVVNLLNDLYTCFDAILGEFKVYKVETIGDAYMVVSGLPERIGSQHASEIARMSLALLKRVQTFKIRHKPNVQLKLRIGIHSGPVCAGVVGSKMPRYCLFGDTVNTASRMESNGLPLKIHMSQTTKDILDQTPGFEVELRGEVEMKGKGKQTTYWLNGYNHPSCEKSRLKDEAIVRRSSSQRSITQNSIG